ncbi:ParB N-terminal domain-containing protein [Blastococcus sp. TF02A-26]|uniref:ParB N-terminal domain-containing protein n=1 Tax=Blastococcus sp. TF02A-26 TaxID=2250577 RepID=UPI000DE892B0|nr:ParB N-terminal domain-containing protein [Blastococcus sp. TF02A-26]RBY82698.1 hypothetical protein DQ240_18570 [Blastococcus sp. TF02A-26]
MAERMPLAQLLAQYGPGSYGPPWSWDDEVRDLVDQDPSYQRELEAELLAQGVREPVLLGPDGRVWDGHHRVVAAIRLGLPDLPVLVAAETPA